MNCISHNCFFFLLCAFLQLTHPHRTVSEWLCYGSQHTANRSESSSDHTVVGRDKKSTNCNSFKHEEFRPNNHTSPVHITPAATRTCVCVCVNVVEKENCQNQVIERDSERDRRHWPLATRRRYGISLFYMLFTCRFFLQLLLGLFFFVFVHLFALLCRGLKLNVQRQQKK